MIDGGHLGHDVAATDHRVEMGQLAVDAGRRRVEPDLLVRLAERGVERRLAGIHSPARKLTSPLWCRSSHERRVSNTSGPVGPSWSRISTAECRASGKAGNIGCSWSGTAASTPSRLAVAPGVQGGGGPTVQSSGRGTI